MLLAHFNRFRDSGLFILRIGLGVAFIIHGLPKLTGGVEAWTELGKAMGFIGVTSYPAFWGFMAGMAEFGGGILLIAGFMFRPACLVLSFNMLVAMLFHIGMGENFEQFSHAMEDGIVFVALFLIGPGKYSIDERFVVQR
jgi:putative oxidoreductase